MTGIASPFRLPATEWLQLFRRSYDESALDTGTEVGLFYERHREFIRSKGNLDPKRAEYADVEWTGAFAALSARLARTLGFYQVRDWTGGSELIWFRFGDPLRVAALIHHANNATDDLIRRTVPRLVTSGAELSVLVMYPDYPAPDGAGTVEEATEVWRFRVEACLISLEPKGGFLLITIGSDEWRIPSPWRGFIWSPSRRKLEPLP